MKLTLNNHTSITTNSLNNKEYKTTSTFLNKNLSGKNVENKAKTAKIYEFIKKKYLRPLSSYKVYSLARKKLEFILELIIVALDSTLQFFKIDKLLSYIFPSYEPNHGTRKFLLSENEIWGMPKKYSLRPTEREAEDMIKNLLATFNDEKTAYLMIFHGLDEYRQHAAMFIGAAGDEQTNKSKFTSWNQSTSKKKKHNSLKKEIMLHGEPDIIAIPNLDTQAMQERWQWIVNSNVKYSVYTSNCCHIINNLINWGLGFKDKPINNKLLFSPEDLKKVGLKLKLERSNVHYDKHEISPPILVRRIHLKNQQQLMEECKGNNKIY